MLAFLVIKLNAFMDKYLEILFDFLLTKLSKVCTKASQALEANTDFGDALTTFGSKIASLGKLLFTLIPFLLSRFHQ